MDVTGETESVSGVVISGESFGRQVDYRRRAVVSARGTDVGAGIGARITVLLLAGTAISYEKRGYSPEHLLVT